MPGVSDVDTLEAAEVAYLYVRRWLPDLRYILK